MNFIKNVVMLLQPFNLLKANRDFSDRQELSWDNQYQTITIDNKWEVDSRLEIHQASPLFFNLS